MHLNGEVNGSCRDNVDMCGIISCDIAPSKLLNDAGNDSVGNESDNSVLSNSVGVEENGNVGSSDSDDEETMDVPSDYSSNHVQGGEHTELAVDGVMDDSGSQDGVDMDSDVAETVDSPVPNSAADDSVQGDVSETSGAMVTDNLQETDVARLGGDLQETDVDDEEDSSHDIDMEERDDMEDGDEAEGEILEEIDSVERDDDDDVEEIGRAETDDNTEESVRLERDSNAEEIGRPEREDSSEETSREERADELETSAEGKDADLQRTEERIEEESQEMSVSGPEDVLQTVNKEVEQPGSLDESMEVEDNSVTTKSVCDSTTKESDECPQPSSGMGTLSCSDRDNKDVASVETAEPDCVSTDSGVTNSVGKLGGCTGVVEVSGAVKVEDTLSSDKAEGKLDETPGKIKKARKSSTPLNVTPRRSSRNLSKTQKVYSEHEEDPDIEEITPQDPLADPLSGGDVLRDKDASKPRASHHNKTIVVNDTKRLVEIAAGSKPSKGRKKEPTLVIIDTNSILSGRGPIPVSQSVQSSGNSSTPGYSMLPVALPAQGLYPNSVAPSASPTVMPNPLRTSTPIATTPQSRQPPPQILPSLTDDMYVVEAPSFIVPYVYEKPPIKPLKEYVEGMGKELEKLKEERERKASEASNKTSEQSATEKADTSKNSGEGKSVQEKDEDKRGEKEKLNANDGSINLSEQNKVTNGENGEGSENSKQLNKLDTSELKHEVKSSSINGDISMELDGKEGLKSEDKDKRDLSKAESTKPTTYFDNPLGKFFMQIGVNLVQEYVQTDLLRSQKKKRDREGGRGASVTQFAIGSLLKNLELSKENNEPFHLPLKKCNFCNFKTESALVMAQHLETPHMKNYVYRCNFCTLEVRSPHDILFHMEAEHNVRGRLERAPAFHQCPNCPFEDNQKGKLSRHLFSCGKKFKPEKNQEPPLDWEPPAKIPRVSRNRPSSMGIAYQALTNKQAPQHPLLPKLVPSPQLPVSVGSGGRGRGRPPLHSRYLGDVSKVPVQRPIAPTQIRQSMLYRSTASGSPMLVPTTYQISGNQIYQVVGAQGQMMPVMSSGITPVPRIALMSTASTPPSVVSSAVSSAGPTPVTLVPSNAITIQNAHKNNPTAKLLQQPSISITPLPRQPATVTPPTAGIKQATTSSGGKATFVICEICDGYIKDLEQLRNHMQWIHKVKIHPKMIYNRPPLNCQKCQFRFFTDQGLERHLLGSHGLVTSSMQEAANKGKDGGRCPVCGRVYQWKLLNHVARDHNMTLKPAHLSYKCTVCTATFGMYKQFENHVYSAHSVVAKRVMDKKTSPSQSSRSSGAAAAGDSLLKPLKINDEITIIPQPARPRPGPASRTGAVSAAAQAASGAKVWQCDDCEATFDGPTGFVQFTAHMKRRHLRRCSVRLCRLDACPTCKRRHVTGAVLEWLRERSGVDVIELSDDEVVIGQGRSEITITKVSCAPGPKRFKQRLQRTKVQVIEIEDSPVKTAASEENGEDSLTAVKERLRRRKSLEISQIDSDGSPQTTDDLPSKKRRKTGDD